VAPPLLADANQFAVNDLSPELDALMVGMLGTIAFMLQERVEFGPG
jgi:hypothetical protein